MAELEKRERKTRRDKGKRLMTVRDEWLLRWIAEQYVIRFDQLRQLLSNRPGNRDPKKAPGPAGVTDSAVNQVLARWLENPAWVQYQRIYAAAPGWIWTTPYGERLLELPYTRHLVRESRLSHRYYINCVRLDYERRHPEYRWVSERQLLSQLGRREPGVILPHLPDAEIWLPDNRVVVVEIELSPKDDPEMDGVLQELLTGQRGYRAAWYFVSDADAVYAQAWRGVERARKRLPVSLQRRVQIVPLAKVGAHDAGPATASTNASTRLRESPLCGQASPFWYGVHRDRPAGLPLAPDRPGVVVEGGGRLGTPHLLA